MRRHLVGAVVLGGIGLMVVVQLIPPADLGFPAHQMDPGRSLLLLDALTLNRPLSLVVLVLSAVWFWRQRLFLLWAMPTLGLLALCVFAWASVWHEGVLYYYWVFCLWLSFQRVASDHPATPSLALSSSASLPPAAGVATGSQDDKDSARPVTRFRFCCARSGRPSLLRGSALPTPGPRWLKPAVELAFVVVLGWHLHWSIVCSFHDAAQAYSGSRAASSYLLAHQLQEEVIYAHGFSTISVLPYFPRNVFDNYNQKRNPSYLVWSQTNPLLQTRKSLLADAPQYVLVGIKRRGDDGLDDPDYELVKRFEGHVFWKHGVLEPDVFLLYRRRSGRSAGSRLAAAR